MNSSLSKREINRQRWLERIANWKQGGQSQKTFCEQNHIGLASFQRWHRIFKTEEKTIDHSPVAFLPVNVTEPSSSNLTLRVNDNLRIDISAGFDATTLKQVIQVLQVS